MQKVLVEKQGPLTLVRLNRPAVRNAVDAETAQQLLAAFEAFETDETARVAVLGGVGQSFCSGADLKSLALADPNAPTMVLNPYGQAPLGVSRLRLQKPVIAAIQGYAVAGGLELALWCDLRVVEKTSVLGVFCRRWGVPLIDGGTVRLPRLIGLSRALDLILTGRAIDGQEALDMGLANRLVPEGQAWDTAVQLAKQLSRFPQNCLRNDRLSAYEQVDMDLEAALRNEFYKGTQTLLSQETFEGAQRFAEGKGRHGSYEDI
ncbi:crotonase/enoyl-CoA hydratase family protein [Eisenibacter elegans]|jgi:enoyl-CoA hydratase|uniref:crotonase/enoyl-CoA hydratase family protein n=1 Tax=Eisenibacter elegans TaxID=997 RepID=UPI0003F98CD8|nr:crotonase/enoyl-CoA hydratase family protein [Eisenibacter elegans]